MWLLLIASQVTAAASIVSRRVSQPHIALLAYLIASVSQIAGLALVQDRGSPGYRDLWLATQGAILALWLAVTAEHAIHTLRSLPGLRILSPALLVALSALCSIVAVASLPDRVSHLGVIGVLTPTVAIGCALFVSGLLWILRGLDLPANRAWLGWLLAFHFTTTAAGSIASYYSIQIPLLSAGSVLFNLGVLGLSRKGESKAPLKSVA